MNFEFTLIFRLPPTGRDPKQWLDALYEAGCDDATIGVGRPGAIAFHFSREAASSQKAIKSAIQNVKKAILGATLTEIGPDLVNLADISDLLGCTRQNVQKYSRGNIQTVIEQFPDPVVSGPTSLWRLAEVACWFANNTKIKAPPNLMELAQTTSIMNLELQKKRLEHV